MDSAERQDDMSMLQMFMMVAGGFIIASIAMGMPTHNAKLFKPIALLIGVVLYSLPLFQQTEKYQHFIALNQQIEMQDGKKNFHGQVQVTYDKDGKIKTVLLDPKSIVVEK